MSTKKNTWHTNQDRNGHLFAPKWDKDTILYIIDQLNQMIDHIDIQFNLSKSYGIKLRSADRWISIAKRVMVDMNNGLSIDDALERDRERRNLLRKRKTAA